MSGDPWSPPRGVTSFACGDDLLLFRESTGDLFLLNDTAAYIWRELKAGRSPGAVCWTIAVSTNASPKRVAHDVRALIDEWDRWAALAAAGRPVDEGLPEPGAPAKSESDAFECAYRLLDLTFAVRTPHRDALRIVAGLFDHLSPGPAATATVFDVVQGPQQTWRLMANARLLGECNCLEGLAPLLHAQVLMSAYLNVDCLAALHAAVVVDEERAILMPARSGDGKSTLTAALVAAGYGYCTDDLAVLTSPPVKIRAAPVSIGLKAGSWAPLARKLPLLKEHAVHVRLDGRAIRYFVPPPHRIAPRDRDYDIRSILFPRYEDGAALSCRPVRSGEALLRVTRAGYDARLSASVVAALTEWLGALPAYELRYSDLDEAVAAIGAISR